MIISDQNKFVFVHIPKCAGTSIKKHFDPYGNKVNIFDGHSTHHPELGRLDHSHIPLVTLKNFFKEEYEKINAYWTFTVVRDPYKRFPSSMAQRLKSHCGTPIQNLTKKEIIQEVDATINFLTKNPKKNIQLPAAYIHLQKQVDYIYLNGEKIVDSVFTIDNIDVLLDQFYKYIGCELPSAENSRKRNQSIVFRNDILRRTIEIARPFTQFVTNHMSNNLKEKIHSMIYVSSGQKHSDIFQSNSVKDFITDYYKDDIQLVKQLQEEEAKKV